MTQRKTLTGDKARSFDFSFSGALLIFNTVFNIFVFKMHHLKDIVFARVVSCLVGISGGDGSRYFLMLSLKKMTKPLMISSFAFCLLGYQSAAGAEKKQSSRPSITARHGLSIPVQIPSKQTDLDHLTLSLRDVPKPERLDGGPSLLSMSPHSGKKGGNAPSGQPLNKAPALLSLREADDAAVSMSGVPSFFGINSGLNTFYGRSRSFPDDQDGSSAFDPMISGPEFLLGGGIKKADGSISPALKLALKGSYAIRDLLNPGIFGESNFGNSFYSGPNVFTGLETRDVNVGLRLGYSSFNLDASILRRNAVFLNDAGFGYEAGLSYVTNGFSARFSARQYREGVDLVGFDNEFRKLVSFEFGARYRLTSRFGVMGGVRYFEYGDGLLTNFVPGEKSQMIFLGGRFSF